VSKETSFNFAPNPGDGGDRKSDKFKRVTSVHSFPQMPTKFSRNESGIKLRHQESHQPPQLQTVPTDSVNDY